MALIIRGEVYANTEKEAIELIMNYEVNPENIYIFQERQRLWYYMDELKENKYLSKYIISI